MCTSAYAGRSICVSFDGSTWGQRMTFFNESAAAPLPPRKESGIAAVVAMMVIATLTALVIAGFIFLNNLQATTSNLREEGRLTRMARQSMMEADAAVLNALTRPATPPDIAIYSEALNTFNQRVGEHFPASFFRDGETVSTKTAIDEMRHVWAQAMALGEAGEFYKARDFYTRSNVTATLIALTRAIADQLQERDREIADKQQLTHAVTTGVLALQILTGMICLIAFATAARKGQRESQARALTVSAANSSREQVLRLFQMTDMLQSAGDLTDANAVLRSTAAELIPDHGGALYVFNNSRDRLVLSTSWGLDAEAEAVDSIGLQQCWALKRGKSHINRPNSHKLCCEHHRGSAHVLEIPMIARGEILGLLQIHSDDPEAETQLGKVTTLGVALADAMSLALANLALRDKLRSQALRDPLTGLYNRRYMEDTLQRVVRLAERDAHEVSVIMIDLDHFKRLNDQYGHAKGDAVLRDAAAAIIGQLRETDIACRYGGEELIVVLPNCGADAAMIKAERIRASLKSLSEPGGAQVSASLGVACFPGTASSTRELVANADAALYQAKQAGRDRVIRATPEAIDADTATTPAGDADRGADSPALLAAE